MLPKGLRDANYPMVPGETIALTGTTVTVTEINSPEKLMKIMGLRIKGLNNENIYGLHTLFLQTGAGNSENGDT